MQAIWKYPLEYSDEQIVVAPVHTWISAVNQNEAVCAYGIVANPQGPVLVDSKYRFHIVGTGHPMEFDYTSCKFLGTVSTMGGRLIWHVYVERVE